MGLAIAALVCLCTLSGIAGSAAASARNAAVQGFLAGFLLGPLGALAALGFDGRPQCPRCFGRLDGPGHVCQHCRVALEWPKNGCPPIVRSENRQPAGEYQRALADIERDQVKAEAVALAALVGRPKPPVAKPLR